MRRDAITGFNSREAFQSFCVNEEDIRDIILQHLEDMNRVDVEDGETVGEIVHLGRGTYEVRLTKNGEDPRHGYRAIIVELRWADIYTMNVSEIVSYRE